MRRVGRREAGKAPDNGVSRPGHRKTRTPWGLQAMTAQTSLCARGTGADGSRAPRLVPCRTLPRLARTCRPSMLAGPGAMLRTGDRAQRLRVCAPETPGILRLSRGNGSCRCTLIEPSQNDNSTSRKHTSAADGYGMLSQLKNLVGKRINRKIARQVHRSPTENQRTMKIPNVLKTCRLLAGLGKA